MSSGTTTSPGTIRSLEGLRGIAALGVALLHFELEGRQIQSMSEAYLGNAYLLVDLFFVLSGFVIARAYEKRLVSAAHLGNFLVRRTGRLYPLFVFSTIAFIAVNNLSAGAKSLLVHLGYAHLFNKPETFAYVLPSFGELLSAATLTHSLGFFDRLILNYPSWSISVEYYTYLVFGVCAALLASRARPWIYAALLVLAGTVTVTGSLASECVAKKECLYLTTDFGIFRSIAGFMLGVIAARWAQRPGFFDRLSSTPAQVAAFACVAFVLVYARTAPRLAFLAPVAFFALILSVAADRGGVAALLGQRVPAYLGRISYSIYLMHAPLLVIFAYLLRAAHNPIQMILAGGAFVATVLVVSSLTFKYIEEPFRLRANALADRLFLK